MNKIKLSSGNDASVTLISNTFIDRYMTNANGVFVKVYLYLLRCLSSTSADISLSSIADKLEETEGDVMRALKYWEKVNVLTVSKNVNNQICDITILDLDSTHSRAKSIPAPSVQIQPAAQDKPSRITQVNFSKPGYSPMQLEQFRSFDDFNEIVDYIEHLCCRTLTVKDLQTPAFLYESLEFSPELIKYLFEFCFSKNKKSFAYIEKVARDWSENNITTVEAAKASAAAYSKEYSTVTGAFGLSRSLGDLELKFVLRWYNDFCMNDEVIREACSRSLLKTGRPDFKYADKILENWHNAGARTIEAVERCDRIFAESQKKNTDAKRSQPSPVIPNKFNNYIQRSYSSDDYSSIEEKWLKRN